MASYMTLRKVYDVMQGVCVQILLYLDVHLQYNCIQCTANIQTPLYPYIQHALSSSPYNGQTAGLQAWLIVLTCCCKASLCRKTELVLQHLCCRLWPCQSLTARSKLDSVEPVCRDSGSAVFTFSTVLFCINLLACALCVVSHMNLATPIVIRALHS